MEQLVEQTTPGRIFHSFDDDDCFGDDFWKWWWLWSNDYDDQVIRNAFQKKGKFWKKLTKSEFIIFPSLDTKILWFCVAAAAAAVEDDYDADYYDDDDGDTDAYADADAVLGARDAEADGVLRDVVPLEQAAWEGTSHVGNTSVQG